MLNSLDWLIIVFMVLAVLTLVSVVLTFVLKSKLGRRISFYSVLALTVYLATVAFRIGSGFFTGQVVFSFVTVLLAVGAFVLERCSKWNEKLFLVARILAANTLVIGFANAIL